MNIFYYNNPEKGKDRNFKKAAETKAREMRSKGERVVLIPITTESDFKNAWNSINPNTTVTGISIFSHGDYRSLEFNPKNLYGQNDTNDGTLSGNEIK